MTGVSRVFRRNRPRSAAELAALRAAVANPAARAFPGAVMVFDAGLRYAAVTGSSPSKVGLLSPELLEGNTLSQVFHADVVAVVEPCYRLALAGQESQVEVRHADRILRQQLGPLRDVAGQIFGGIAFTTDVTSARRSAAAEHRQDGAATGIGGQVVGVTATQVDEQMLAERRRRLSEAEAIGRVGLWELDVASRKLTWSSGAFAIWGVDPERFDADQAAALRGIHPDEAPVVSSAIEKCVSDGESVSVRARVVRADDGLLSWVHIRGEARWAGDRVVGVRGAVADITEQIRAEADSVAARSFQEAVFNASPDVISVWDFATQSILWTNCSIPDLLGYSARDVVDMGGGIGAVLPAEDRIRATNALAAARDARDDRVVQVDYRMVQKDGATRWFSQRTAPLQRDEDGRVAQVVGILSDTTQAKAAEAALRESESLFRQLADSVDVGFVLRTHDPVRYLYISPGYERIWGFNPMTSTESPEASRRRIHPADVDRFMQDYWAPSEAGAPAQIEYRIIRSDGEIRWLRSKSAPVGKPEENLHRTASTIEDITDRRGAEAALLAARTAEKANAAKNEFLSRMSHELRTPLNAVLGFAQLLDLDPLTRDQQGAVKHILRGGRHLLGLIDDVLDISKIESDHLDMSLELVPVSELLAQTVELMVPQATAAGVTLRYQPNPSARRSVQADHRRLRQVVLNLLSNAIKYNRPGGRIDVSCEISDNDRLDIEVSDTGRGIRAEDLPRLFTPFDRLGVQSTGIEGTGVGLALSHRLMALMGGRLTATSQEGIGSSFTASIPLAADQRAEPGPVPAATGWVAPPPYDIRAPRRTVLYVEDNSSDVGLMERLISRRPQWHLVVAGHGALALELAVTSEPDLVLLDLHLPDMNGIDILQQLRWAPGGRARRVVVVSADANPNQVQRLLAAGAHAYLTKPLDVAKVLELLDAADSAEAVPR